MFPLMSLVTWPKFLTLIAGMPVVLESGLVLGVDGFR